MKPNVRTIALALLSVCFVWTWMAAPPALAAPPVRIAVVPAGGSGQEQSAVDGIISRLEANANIAISTVNPDWYVVCNIVEQTDLPSSTVKVNGTVTIKTTDGHILNTIAVQTNKSDFNLQPGAPINKVLIDKAVREVIQGMTERAIKPIEDAVAVEISTRDRIIQAEQLAAQDQYEEAVGTLLPVSPDTPHFRAVRALINEFRMEQQALELVKQAQSLASNGQYLKAIQALNGVDPKSKRFPRAKQLIAEYRAAQAAGLRKVKRSAPRSTGASADPSAQLKALEAQKRALDEQKRALEAQEAALRSKPAK